MIQLIEAGVLLLVFDWFYYITSPYVASAPFKVSEKHSYAFLERSDHRAIMMAIAAFALIVIGVIGLLVHFE